MSRTQRDHVGCSGYGHFYIGAKWKLRGRDWKPWNKPPRWFKVMRSRIRRAKDRMRLLQGRDAERWRRDDQWRWT